METAVSPGTFGALLLFPLSFTMPLPRPASDLLKQILILTMSMHVHLTWSVSILL